MGGGFLEEMNNMNRDYLVSRKNPMDVGEKVEEEINDCCRKEESSKHLYETFSNPIDLDVMEDYYKYMSLQIDNCCQQRSSSSFQTSKLEVHCNEDTPVDLDMLDDYYKNINYKSNSHEKEELSSVPQSSSQNETYLVNDNSSNDDIANLKMDKNQTRKSYEGTKLVNDMTTSPCLRFEI